MPKNKFDPERDIVHDVISASDGLGYIHVVGSFYATFYLLNGTKILQCVVVELPRRGDEVQIGDAVYAVAAVLREYSDVSPVHNATIHVD